MRFIGQSPRPPHGVRARSLGVQLVGIDEAPSWTDPALARLFSDMRSAAGYTHAQMAARLDTTTGVVLALEAGRLRALPSWPVTQRVVATYGRLLGIDMSPALARIRQQTAAADPTLADPEAPHTASRAASAKLPMIALPVRRPSAHDTRARWLSRPVIALAGLVLVGLVFVPRVPSGLIEAGISALPAQLTASAGAAYARWSSGRRGSTNDLQWIDVADPGSRKTDKLHPAPR